MIINEPYLQEEQLSLFTSQTEEKQSFILYEVDKDGEYILSDGLITRWKKLYLTKRELIDICNKSNKIILDSKYNYSVYFESDKYYELSVRFGNFKNHKSKTIHDHIDKYFGITKCYTVPPIAMSITLCQTIFIKDWEVVELVYEHKGKSIIRYKSIKMQVNRKEFHTNFDLIPERITNDK